MALGKNIIVKKSSDEKKSELKNKSSKKKIEKKKLISKKPLASKVESKKKESSNSLFRYITEETLKRKTALRQRYIQEIESAKGKLMQFIVFKIGSDEFAIDIELIKEVVPFSGASKIPNAPQHILGATIVRGKTITAVDLESKFNKKTSANYEFTITLKSKTRRVGLLVNHLPLALKIDGAKIDGNLGSLESSIEDETYIKGIIKHQDRLIFYLDIEELLEGDKAIVVPNEIVDNR